MTTDTLPVPASTFGAFRICEHGRGIAYTAHMEWTGLAAVQAVVRQADRAGILCPAALHDGRMLTDGCHTHHAVLDLLRDNGDIVNELCIPDVAAWEWWARAVELRPSSSDCSACAVVGLATAEPGD